MSDTDQLADVGEAAGIEGYRPEFVDVDGTRTRYYDVGSGETLVLVHGGNWGGFVSANDWTATFEHLSGEFRVLAFDRLACGLTDPPERASDYRYGAELDHALGFLDALGVDTCHLVGSSRGGGLAARLAVEDPDRVETLVLLNSGTLGPPSGDKDFRRGRVIERVAPDTDRADPAYVRFCYEQYCHELEHVTEEFCRAGASLRSRPAAREAAEVMDDRYDDWVETLRAEMRVAHERIRDGVLDAPTLYLYGRNDLTVPLEMAVASFDLLSQANPDVRLELVNHCGHLMYREHPAEFARRVSDFVDFWG